MADGVPQELVYLLASALAACVTLVVFGLARLTLALAGWRAWRGDRGALERLMLAALTGQRPPGPSSLAVARGAAAVDGWPKVATAAHP